jgi:hypothetical protein
VKFVAITWSSAGLLLFIFGDGPGESLSDSLIVIPASIALASDRRDIGN